MTGSHAHTTPSLADEPHRSWIGHSFAIFKTNTKMNPAHPEDNDFYEREQVAYVLRRDNGRLLVATSFGSLQLEVSKRYDFHHDQSRRFMGCLEVIGVKSFSTGEVLGDAPDQPVPHFVFK